MIKCRDCKFWQRFSEKENSWGSCNSGKIKSEMAIIDKAEKTSDMLVVWALAQLSWDADFYNAHHATGQNFGCIHAVAKKEEKDSDQA